MSPERIYLIGFMGCGKSTIGFHLADTIQYDFVDLDHLIETGYKKSIAQLFDEVGESGFRQIENEVLLSTQEMKKTVIATGGGTPCFFDNMNWLNANGTTVYIKSTMGVLLQRLIISENRPLVHNKTKAQLIKYIRETLNIRKPYYEKAHLKATNRGPVEKVVERILRQTEFKWMYKFNI